MIDKELADKVVALELDGLHGRYAHKAGNREWFTYARDMEAKEFVRDWRVAGVLMEKLNTLSTQKTTDGWLVGFKEGWVWEKTTISNESLPRAIIEACVEALDKEQT